MKEMVSLVGTRSTTERWMADVTVYPAGEKHSLVYAKSTGATCLVHAAYSELLEQCREFKTLDEHLGTFYRRKQLSGFPLSAEVVQGLRTKLQQLAQEGYLISLSQLAGLFRETEEPVAPTRITTLGFPTCDRIGVLQNSLSSYLENCQRFGRSPEIVVADDSQSLSTREAYREMLRGLQKRFGLSIAYAGLEEKMAYVRKLSEVGQIPEEVVSWACVGDRTYGVSTHGANRNALLLHTVGECLFLSDDDTMCRVAASPGFQKGLTIRSQGNLLQYWYYPDRESALEAAPEVEQDLLALHEQWLGRDPRVAGASYGQAGQFTIEQTEPGFLRHFATQPGKIALTLNGIIGDASLRTPDFLFFLPDESLKRQMSSEEAYHSGHTSREIAQVATQPTLTRPSYYIMNVGGLDNRELLPPFTPVGRSEDTAFGLMLRACFPDAYSVYLPWMALHAPPEARVYLAPIVNEGVFISRNVPFYEWLPWCLCHFHSEQVGTPAEHLSQLGQFLEQIGRLPTSAFEEFACHFLWQHDGGHIANLEQRLHQGGDHLLASWKRDAEAYCTQARQSMLVPIKQRLQGGAEMAQRSLGQFAQILHWWPAMVETARGLRADGIRVAQPL